MSKKQKHWPVRNWSVQIENIDIYASIRPQKTPRLTWYDKRLDDNCRETMYRATCPETGRTLRANSRAEIEHISRQYGMKAEVL